MPKIVLKKKAEVLKELDLSNSRTSFSIGSADGNDLLIDDRLVSLGHASIERSENRYFIRDLQSAFGTYLNGQKIDDIAELKNGDNINIGEHSILFDNPLGNVELSFLYSENEPESEEEDNGSHYRDDHAKLDKIETKIREESLSLLQQGNLDDGVSLPYKLIAIYGPYAGKKYLLKHPETKIGRDESLNDIVLDKNKKGKPDQSISRRHATIIHKDGSFFVTDKRSKTRTYVNRSVIPEDGEIELFVNDEIEIVSDQQSTIFRLVANSQPNCKPPRKAGVWWVRYQHRLVSGVLGAIGIAGIFLAATGFSERKLLTQKPEPLVLEVQYWSTDKSLSLQSGGSDDTQDQVFRLVPAVSDFNGDEFLDIVTTNITNKPLLIDGATRAPKWLIDTIPANPHSALMAADINQNGLDDLIYLSTDGRIVAIDGKHGAEIWVSPFINTDLTGPPVIDDFDGDDLNDIAIADLAGNIHVGYNRLLTMEWASINAGIAIKCPLTSADLDKDGDSELICGSERGIVFIFDGQNRNILGTIDINDELNQALGSLYEDNQIRFPVGVADLNGDKREDLVVTSVQGRILAIDGSTRKRLWYDSLTNGFSVKTNHIFPFALGDFDSDGLVDVVTTSADGEIRTYSGKGIHQRAQVIWRLLPESPAAVQQSFVVGDINKDYITDVSYADESGALWILDGKTGETLIATEKSTNTKAGMPLAADLSGNSYLDFFFVAKSGIVFQYESNCRVPTNAIVWGQQFGQHQNSLQPAFQLPKTMKANASILLGILIFMGSGATTLIAKRRHRL